MEMPQLPTKYVYIILGFIAVFLVVNVLLLDFFLVKQRGDLLDFQTRLTQLSESFRMLGGRIYTSTSGENSAAPAPLALPAFDNGVCPMSCVDLISLATLSGRLSTRDLIAPTYSTTTTPSTKGEFFVPMGSGSISSTNDWTNVDSAQVTFDAGNYGSIRSAYFEVFLHVQTGEVHARLFDVSTPAVFWTSDLKSNSNTAQFLSAPITLSSGTKTYKVQMTSTISTGYLDQARIRIVTQ